MGGTGIEAGTRIGIVEEENGTGAEIATETEAGRETGAETGEEVETEMEVVTKVVNKVGRKAVIGARKEIGVGNAAGIGAKTEKRLETMEKRWKLQLKRSM